MKNACLVITNQTLFPCDSYAPVLSAFARNGYSFQETRVLPLANDELVRAAFIDLKNAYENVAVIACGVAIGAIRALMEDVFQKSFPQETPSGVGVHTQGAKTLFLLSADSKETGEIYAEAVCVPHLNAKYAIRQAAMAIRCVGVDGQALETVLAQARRMGNGLLSIVATTAYGETVIRIFYGAATPKLLLDDVVRFVMEQLNENVYAMDDTPLEVQLIQLLKLRGKKISVAESFTGGGIAQRIVSVSGASSVYFEGLNTYAEASKMARLGVSEYTLRTHGAVSKETAYEMAAGLLSTGNCQVAISTTGLAGPQSDGSGLPIGLCCIGVGVEDKVYVYSYRLDGDRETITKTAINYALFLACKQLKNL